MTQAGDLKFRLAFESRNDVSGDDDGRSESAAWFERFRRWAKIEPRFLGEAVISDRLAGRSTVTITVPNDPESRTISAAFRARDVEAGTIYDIRAMVDPDSRREWIELLAQTGGAP